MLWGGYKLIQCSQARQPIIITPLTIGYKPLVAGLTGYQRDTVIANLRGAWHRFTTDVKQGWDEMVETGAVKTWFSGACCWVYRVRRPTNVRRIISYCVYSSWSNMIYKTIEDQKI